MARVHPWVGSGRFGLGRVAKFSDLGGSGWVGDGDWPQAPTCTDLRDTTMRGSDRVRSTCWCQFSEWTFGQTNPRMCWPSKHWLWIVWKPVSIIASVSCYIWRYCRYSQRAAAMKASRCVELHAPGAYGHAAYDFAASHSALSTSDYIFRDGPGHTAAFTGPTLPPDLYKSPSSNDYAYIQVLT